MKIESFILLKIVGVWELTVHITQHPCNIFKYFNYFLFEKPLSITLDLLAKVRVLLKPTKVKPDGLMLPFHFFSPVIRYSRHWTVQGRSSSDPTRK